jgi:putative ABC transport system substrate-binding protein
MRRRDFIKVIAASAVAWPLTAQGEQSDRMRRISFLSPIAESDPEEQAWIRELTHRLEELGWANGRNVQIDFRFGSADATRMAMLATELIDLRPDVMFAVGSPAAAALRQQSLNTNHFCAGS